MQTLLKSSIRRRRISLTPLIDVIFLLLVFFMLSSHFQHYGVMQIDLTRPSSDLPPQTLTIIDIESNGDLLIDGRTITDITTIELTDDAIILVRSAASVPIKRTLDIMHSLRQSGTTNISLETRDE